MLAVVPLGGVLHPMLPGLVAEPEPEPVAVEEVRAAYAGGHPLGEPAWCPDDSRLAQEDAEAWTEHVDDVVSSEQVAHDDFDAGTGFLALKGRIEAPENGADYRNDVVPTHNARYARLRDGEVSASDGDPVQNPEDVNLVATRETLHAHADLDDELVHELARAVYEDLGGHTRYADVTPLEPALAGVDPDDVHPGAARCLREQGVL